MGVVYQLAVTPWQADRYLSHGAEEFCGFAVDAASVEDVRDAAVLRELLLCKVNEASFPPDEPLHILKAPVDPFVHTRRAVGPLHPDAFLGGVTEDAPYDPSGVVSAGGVTAELLWIEPGRLTRGSELWRLHPGDPSPELAAVYHGVAWGWENAQTGEFVAAEPSKLMGPVVKREWGTAAVDVETEGGKPTALTLVSPRKPPESGFERLSTDLWAKRIEYRDDLNVHENYLSALAHGVPVRVTRLANSPNGMDALGFALLVDAPYAIGNRVLRISPGAFFCVMPMDEMERTAVREGRPETWDVSAFPAVTTLSLRERSNYDVDSLLKDIHALIENVAPEGWRTCTLIAQIVGGQSRYGGNFFIPAPAGPFEAAPSSGDASGSASPSATGLPFGAGSGAASSEDGSANADDGARQGPGSRRARSGRPRRPVYGGVVEEISLLPSAVLEYLGQIKKLAATPERGAPLAFTLQASASGETKLNVTYEETPPLVESITPQAWAAEMEAFPRPNPPDWASRFTDSGDGGDL